MESKAWDQSTLTKACQILEMMLETPISIRIDQSFSAQNAILLDILNKNTILLDVMQGEQELELLCNEIYNKELEDNTLAYKMSSLRRKIARCLHSYDENVSGTCFFNSFLDQLIGIIEARGASIDSTTYTHTAVSSKEEECVGLLFDYIKDIGWENIPLGEREEVLLCFCKYYYAKKMYVDISTLVMEVIETGVANPLIYIAYFQSAVICKEFEAAMEAYNAAIDARSILSVLPLDRYSIKNIINSNQFENVYHGEELYTNTEILVKELKNPPSEVIEKINACHALKHSKVFEILDVKEDSGKTIVISEYFPGQPLSLFIKENGPLDLEKWKEIAMQILGAIAHAHDFDIAHGYLSPDSIYFDGNNIKIADFGFCAGPLWGETLTTENLDNIYYYAPEVVKAEDLSLQSDIYSLGKILSFLLTGEKEDYFNQIMPSFMLKILGKSLQGDPAKRYENAEEMLKNIVAAMQNPTTPKTKINANISETSNLNQKQNTVISDTGERIILPDNFIIKNDQIYCIKDGSIMVLVSEGPFIMGSAERNSESPIHEVQLNHYLIDKFPVTNKQYAKFLHETSRIDLSKIVHQKQTKVPNFRPKNWGTPEYSEYSELPNMPAIFVDWWDAWAYSRWAGKDLPSEAEWEKAARGNDERVYPWGNQLPTNSLANFGGSVGKTTPVGNYPQASSPYGCMDMVGNVWEWCLDTYDPNFYQKNLIVNPINQVEKPSRVLRGGSWNDAVSSIRTTVRGCWMNIVRYSYIGFRCVYHLNTQNEYNS